MRVHHLNCGTMRPASARLINGAGPLLKAGTIICHCLVIETEQGLVLVDTGFGLGSIANPRTLGASFRLTTRPVLDPSETALRQLEALGFKAEDVRHIVLTHLDLDHAGGIADFPQAQIHVYGPEYRAAMSPTLRDRSRYIKAQWAHGPDWAVHELTEGDRWFGFEAVRQLTGLPDDLLLIPLEGHTRGHVGIAVNTGDSWLLHAGDAYFFHGEVDPVKPFSTPGLRAFQNVVQADGKSRHRNQHRLHELAAAHGKEVTIFSAHDVKEFQNLSGGLPH
jgi:glyoxylase-like metal-dependent hydrolase (beta-lactamase superfamily II)